MIYFPYYRETLVLPVPADEALKKLFSYVLPEQDVLSPPKPSGDYIYVGTTGVSWFIIYRKITHPDNFLPLISGQIEGTSVGSILFLHYRLFNSTLIFLLFWTLVSLSLGFYFLFIQKLYVEASITLFLGALNYLITIINFNRNLQKDRALLHKIF